MTSIAFVGCGFVADYYFRTLESHPTLRLVGVYDRDPTCQSRWCEHFGVKGYDSFEMLLADDEVQIVVNLTNPRSHNEVSRSALQAGKHVYSEKPLGTDFKEAAELVELAEASGLLLSGAPCSLLSETAQTAWKALREDRIGRVHLVYAELDDGLVHRMPYRQWRSESGAPWPAKDEFEVGCTLEHAGYYLSWLVAFFGPIKAVTSFGASTVADKQTDEALGPTGPDFTVGCVEFASGVVARITCSIVAPHDHRMRIIGEEGVLGVHDCWYYRSPVELQKRLTIRRRMLLNPWKRRLRLVGDKTKRFKYKGSQQMDFSRGVAEMAIALEQGRPPYLTAQFTLHVNEAVLAISNAEQHPGRYHMTTTCEPLEPLPWAR